jgi:hypothetical protein
LQQQWVDDAYVPINATAVGGGSSERPTTSNKEDYTGLYQKQMNLEQRNDNPK